MPTYTVGKLASLAGLTVRTLHHYDEIGLLKPTARSDSGYRLYGHDALLRLQQILFYREMGFPLREIRRILDDPSFGQKAALEQHRTNLERRIARLERLLRTVDRTLCALGEKEMAVTDEQLYEGFQPKDVERIKREARQRYGKAEVRASENRIKGMSQEAWESLKQESHAVTQTLAELMDRDPGDADVQQLIARHHAVIEHFYKASAERYAGLAHLYVTDPEFRAFYDRYRVGLAGLMSDAMTHYALHMLDA